MIIPTYEEATTVSAVVAGVRGVLPEAHVLVVDDASPDGTGDIAAALAGSDEHVHLLRRSGRLGRATAYLAGFRWGTSRGLDVLVELDADGSHPIEALPALVAAVTGPDAADLAIGSRWVAGADLTGWSRGRRLLSRLGNGYARAMLRLGIRDLTAGYRAYRADALARVDLDAVRSRGSCIQIDLTMRVHDLGLRIVELPITFSDRFAGSSKTDARVVLEALWRTTAWAVSGRGRDGRAVGARSPVPPCAERLATGGTR